MFRTLILLAFLFLGPTVWSQDAIKITDPIPQQKAILVIPGITTSQLEVIKTEFAKYPQIKQAVYVFGDHNCLLVNVEENEAIKFYIDLVKIIQVATNITEQQIAIKTSEVYNKLMPLDLGDESSTNFIVK